MHDIRVNLTSLCSVSRFMIKYQVRENLEKESVRRLTKRRGPKANDHVEVLSRRCCVSGISTALIRGTKKQHSKLHYSTH